MESPTFSFSRWGGGNPREGTWAASAVTWHGRSGSNATTKTFGTVLRKTLDADGSLTPYVNYSRTADGLADVSFGTHLLVPPMRNSDSRSQHEAGTELVQRGPPLKPVISMLTRSHRERPPLTEAGHLGACDQNLALSGRCNATGTIHATNRGS